MHLRIRGFLLNAELGIMNVAWMHYANADCGIVEEIYKEIRSIRFARDARGLAIPSRYALLTV